MPTTFAQQEIDSDGNITGTPNMVTDLKIKITEGVLTQFDVTFGDGLNNPDDYFVLLATDFDAGAGNDVTDTITDDSSGTGYVNMYTDVTTEHTSDNWEWLAGPAAQWYGKSKPGDTVSLTWGSALNKTYNWTTGEDGYGCQLSKDFENSVDSIADLQGAKVWVYILSGKNGFTNFSEKGFMSAVGTFDDKGNLQFPEGGDTPTDTEISSVALTVTAPRIGATPATTATTTTTGVVANPAVTWDPADSTFAKNQAYKASVTLSADSGYKFTDSTTATINGKTATVTLNGDGTLKAEYTFDAIKLTGISSNKTGLTSSFAPNDSYTVPDGLEVTLRYSDGTTEVVPYNKFPENNLSLVIGADSATATDLPTKLTLDNNNQTVYVKYSGTDTNDGNPKYQAIDTITVANAKISTAQVSITYPKPGETPDMAATVPSDANYTAEVTWKDSDGADVSGNFEYDKAYNAIITVKPNTGYALDNTNGVALTVKDKTVTNPGADKTATIASDDIDVDGSGVKTVSFDATTSTPISASITDSFDLYDKNDVNITLTLGTHVIGDITGITIDGQTLSSSDYTISGNIITVKGASLATKLTDLTSTAANKNVEITVTGQTTATTTSLSAVDTTPYITITNPSQGAIISSPTIATGTRVALTKGTAYTLTAPTVAHTTGYTWTVNGITGTDGGQTYTFTPTGGEDITATVALTVDAGHKLTINKTGNGTVTVAKDG